jgi:hypothetical protein
MESQALIGFCRKCGEQAVLLGRTEHEYPLVSVAYGALSSGVRAIANIVDGGCVDAVQTAIRGAR